MRAWLPFVLSAAIATSVLSTGTRSARASVSVAIPFDTLVRASSAVVVGTATDQRSVWEGGRIYTYSRLHVDSAIAGELHEDDEAWVRTIGGLVGDVGQVVDGEAVLTVGRPSLLFLHRTTLGFVVTARAQGQFGLYTDEQSQLRVRKSSAVGALLPAKGIDGTVPLAADIIHGRAVADAVKDIAQAWSRAHAP